MRYAITVTKDFKALQGLSSPIRKAKNLPPLQPAEGYDLQLTVAVSFDESQMNERGWFIDTDTLEEITEDICAELSSKKWTELFDFRPTFENVARYVYQKIEHNVSQLSYVEILNQTISTNTRYGKE